MEDFEEAESIRVEFGAKNIPDYKMLDFTKLDNDFSRNTPRLIEEYTFYLGKKVQIIGIIKEYKGSPEIIVKTPNQIKIIS